MFLDFMEPMQGQIFALRVNTFVCLDIVMHVMDVISSITLEISRQAIRDFVQFTFYIGDVELIP